ncbi:PQQ-binding-like beta-propeller repeat protein [candidate division KSB1 bacterium]|nr:PQQ-binding-like beta-propeller repeat protein [candidate division KSB1 bacterium]
MRCFNRLGVVITISVILSEIFFAANIYSADWPQFRGINRDGQSAEIGLLKQWPAEGPKLLWVVNDCGKGFASPAIVNDIVYVTGMDKDKHEFVSAYKTGGALLWRTTYGSAWEKSFPDVRTTPTIDGDRMYVISGHGEIACLNVKDGAIIWTVDGASKFDAKWGRWGCAESPLVVDNKVFFTPAGDKTTLVAFNKQNGEVIWQSPSLKDQCAYISPVHIIHNKKPFILSVTGTYIYAVNPVSGDIVWKYDYKQHFEGDGGDINTNSPLYHNGSVYVTSGYNHVGIKLNIAKDGNSVSVAWVDHTLDVHHGHVVLVDDNLYGSNWISNQRGNWCCVNWEIGKTSYETTWQNKGSIITAEGMLYCYDEKDGMIALVKANSQKFDIVSQFEVPIGDGPAWAHPAISNGKLYMRRGNGLMVYNIEK